VSQRGRRALQRAAPLATAGGRARAARVAALEEEIAARGALPLAEAAGFLGVSAMTIRRDLAAPGAPLACLGAHVVGRLPAERRPYTLETESDQHAASKRLACQRAAALVQNGDSLFIDCGTTMPLLAEALPPHIALDVVCYSMNVATILSRRPNTQLMLLGGRYHAASASFYSEEALVYLRRLGVNKAFISAGGVHPGRGASCSNFNEVPIKQAALASAGTAILVIDQSKLGQMKPAFFSPLKSFAHIIVGGTPAKAQRAKFRGLALEIVAS